MTVATATKKLYVVNPTVVKLDRATDTCVKTYCVGRFLFNFFQTMKGKESMNKRIQNPPTLAMRFNDADKFALRQLSVKLGKSQTETVRVLVRERLASYSLTEKSKTVKVKR